MDETQISRASDATRKRRSSILKSQRPPRTPFSELEFNVATPTDSAKSRRVSFSKRTGVAEFVTNEATTTWKNFYEEHNKSLESSGNDSGSKQPVGHLGKRAFDQQFEEVEADFIGTLNTGPNKNISCSLNNFEQQLASLECTDDIKLTAPQNRFELSAFTSNSNHTKLFDDLAITYGEVTDRIDINFSNVQQIGENDDLDEIQKDLQQNFGHAPFQRQNISEYIEVDLNATHVKNDDDNMSITDTIHSPKVQDVSKNNSVKNVDKDWVVDKENIAVNPYAAPRESENFAINEEPDKVLVFDGKRLTIQSEKDNYRQTLLPNAPEKAPQRKTIVLNINDDLPNFLDDPHSSNNPGIVGVADLKKNIVLDDMSITEPLQDVNKQRTVLCDDLSNISVTRALPTNIISEENRRTILYEDNAGNISITQSIPVNFPDKQRTIVYDNDDCDISITQAVPTNVVQEKKLNTQQNDKRRTIVFDNCDISMTQAMPANIITENSKRDTIVYEDNAGNLSLTQAVPKVLIAHPKAEKRQTIVYEDGTNNISVTQALPSNIIIAESPIDRSQTVVFENETGNISVTQAVLSNMIWQENVNNMDISETKIVPSKIITENSRRRTIVYENDTGNLSITQAVPHHVIQEISVQNQNCAINDGFDVITNKRKTLVFDNDDIDVTEAVSSLVFVSQKKLILENEALVDRTLKNMTTNDTADNKRKTVVFEQDDVNISMTQAVPTNIIHCLNPFNKAAESTNKRRTVVFEEQDADISTTQAVFMNQLIPGYKPDDLEATLNDALHSKHVDKSQRTIVYDKEENNISISQCLKIKHENDTISQFIRENVMENVVKRRTIVFEDNNISMKTGPVILAETDSILDVSMTENYSDTKKADVSSTKATDPAEKVLRKSFNPEPRPANSASKPIPSSLLTIHNEIKTKSDESKNPKSVESSAGVSQVLIYQTTLTNQNEHDNSENQEMQNIALYDEIVSSSSTDISDENKIEHNDEYSSNSSTASNVIENKQTIESTQELQIEKQNMTVEQNQAKISENRSQVFTGSNQMSKSTLNDLLDMSCASADGIVDAGVMAQVDIPTKESDSEQLPINEAKLSTKTSSNDTLFYITKDVEDSTSQEENDAQKLTEQLPLSVKYKEEQEIVIGLQSKIEDIKDALTNENSLKNRHYEKILSSDLDKSKLNMTKGIESFKKANDTNELLEMLSDLTDKTMTLKRETHAEEDENSELMLVKGQLALENKSEPEEPRRLSFAPTRQSIVMSREDLLNNISMAGAALKSHLGFDDDSELKDTTQDDSPDEKSPMKSARLSNEVVKTLQFDESICNSTIESETKVTPLKKTAFGETSYMQEYKPRKVIPDYLKDVSDGIKELMDDLVKPSADFVPCDTIGHDKHVKKRPSTCSTQIQANLITSSQVDLNTGLYSNPDSAYNVNMNKVSSVDIINDAVNRSVTRALKSPIKSCHKSVDPKTDALETGGHTIIPSKPTEPTPGRVLIFDHNNPLNNILLSPQNCTEVHRYNPSRSTDTICVSERSHSAQISLNEKDNNEVERVSMQYNVESVLNSVQQSGDATSGKITESHSFVSNISKPMSIDQSTDVKLNEVKHIEVNTVIVMKGNKELLETSSSLTLVDDALARSTFDVDIDSRTNTSQEEMAKSPVRVIYEVDKDERRDKLDSDLASNDELDDKTKSTKRLYSPTKRSKHKYCTMSKLNLDVTPKPASKMQKLSENPEDFKVADVSHSTEYSPDDSVKNEQKKCKKKSPRKSKNKKPGTSITVQQLMTEYNVGPIDHEKLDQQIKDVLRDPKSDSSSVEPTASRSEVQEVVSLDMVSSFTSSKNLREDRSVVTSQSSKVSRMDWQPELIDDFSSKNILNKCESSVNVVAKIDMMPFMGSHECEWDSSSGDSWSFRLLHGRLRLTVRLAHRHDNATRTRVRADTPLKHMRLDTLPCDSKNTLATLCVSFAAETMRYFMNRGCSCAGEVPALVRRCAAAARLAARWGRVMCEARHHLAYSVTADGLITLKVANIQLRQVWEVSMCLELVVENAREAPWVRAGGVRVRPLLAASARPHCAPDVTRALRHLPRDWSHAPRTIWRIFKYLKHKTREDDELFMEL